MDHGKPQGTVLEPKIFILHIIVLCDVDVGGSVQILQKELSVCVPKNI